MSVASGLYARVDTSLPNVARNVKASDVRTRAAQYTVLDKVSFPLSHRFFHRRQPTMTWSIIARDPANGAYGIAIASKFFAVGALCPHGEGGVGALSTQSLP